MVQSRELITEHIWSQVNLHYFGIPKTWHFMKVYINLVPMVIYKWKKMKIELTNGAPTGAKAGCPMKGLLLGCDIS